MLEEPLTAEAVPAAKKVDIDKMNTFDTYEVVDARLTNGKLGLDSAPQKSISGSARRTAAGQTSMQRRPQVLQRRLIGVRSGYVFFTGRRFGKFPSGVLHDSTEGMVRVEAG